MLTVCSTHSEYEPYACGPILRSITETLSPTKFDDLLSTYPDYRLNLGARCGWHALGVAATHGNVPLIQHIVVLGGESLLSLGNDFGDTPLFSAVRDCQYCAAQALLELRANVNMETSSGCDDSQRGPTPGGATPLWAAVKRAQNKNLVKLLLSYGAVWGELTFPEQDQLHIHDCRTEMEASCLVGANGIADVCEELPLVLCEMIAHYVGFF